MYIAYREVGAGALAGKQRKRRSLRFTIRLTKLVKRIPHDHSTELGKRIIYLGDLFLYKSSWVWKPHILAPQPQKIAKVGWRLTYDIPTQCREFWVTKTCIQFTMHSGLVRVHAHMS